MQEPQEVKLPERYKAARVALALAVSLDEVKEYRNIAEAMRVYAFQARDPMIASDATDLIGRSTRRIGVLMEVQREAGKLAKGARGIGKSTKSAGSTKPRTTEITLDDQGIDKHLAKQARSAAKLSDEKFEDELAKRKRVAFAAALGDKDVVKAAKAALHAAKKARRAQRELELAEKIRALPEKRYGVIYADPEWKFETYSEEGKLATSAEMHYPTSSLDLIKARDGSEPIN